MENPLKRKTVPQVSVVSPVYNEEKGIQHFIDRTRAVLQGLKVPAELVLVNDGSRDASLAVMMRNAAEHSNVVVVELSRNYGQSVAMTAGLATARGAYIVLLDSDLQDPPELIPEMLEKLKSEDLDVVYAARTSREGETWLKKMTSRWFYRIAAGMTGLNIPDDAGDYRVFRRSVVEAILALPEHNRYLKMMCAYVGFRMGSVPFRREARHSGKTNYNYLHLTNMALNSIFAFSFLPLRMLTLASVGISLVLVLAAGWVFVRKLLGAYAVEGWTSLMLMQTVLFAILFIFLGVISEYIGRTLEESKRRPLYFIRKVYQGGGADVG